MSMLNLLEMDNIEKQPVKDSPGVGKPRPKPRVKINNEKEKPRPKPRRRIERDVDDVLSMSSISGDDTHHVAQSAFDNPVFQAEENIGFNKKAEFESTFLYSESESDKSVRSRRRRKPTDRTRKNSYHESQEDILDASSSAWDEGESYLRIENETVAEEKSKNQSSQPSSRKSSVGFVEKEDVHKMSSDKIKSKHKKGRQESHVTIEVEEQTTNPDPNEIENKTNIDAAKPKPHKGLIGRWKDLLTKTSSHPQPTEKSEKVSGKHKFLVQSSLDKVHKPEEKQTDIKEATIIQIHSDEEPLSGDENQTRKDKGIEMTKLSKSKRNEKSVLPTKKVVAETIIDKIKTIKPKLKSKALVLQENKDKARQSEDHIEEQEPVEIEADDLEEPKSPKKLPKSAKRKKAERQSLVVENSFEQDLLFGITIHSSDLLPLDPNILHPVVKVTVMSQDGKLLQRTQNTFSSESHNVDEANEGAKNENKKKRKKDQKASVSWKKTKPVESILPIMTQPFRMGQRIPSFAPAWNELLLFEELFHKFIDENANVIIFFEVMDFLPMDRTAEIPTAGYHGNEAGWYKVAWAFLKPVGANGVLNVERKLRLQLFKPVKLRTKDLQNGSEVYSWWKLEKREKIYNTTLYVTVKGINPPTGTKASLRQLLSMRKEELTEAIIESQLASTKQSKKSKTSANSNRPKNYIDIRNDGNWRRLEGQSCKVPNRLMASLPSSQIRSLNITVSGNVHCLKFSPCGFKLAVGLDTEELHAVLVFEIPSGTLLRSLKNHHGLIYDISWKLMEMDDDNYLHYLASASADSTAVIWRMKNHDEDTLRIVKTLHHPSYVYCVVFHPTHPSLVVTGCFDNVIRIWDFGSQGQVTSDNVQGDKKKSMKDDPIHDSCPLFILDRHISFVNSLLFDDVGSHLFSGDGNSCVYKWSIKTPTKKRSWKIEKDVKLTDTGRIPVNSLSLHPNGNRLLVHLRDNCLKILDVTTFIQLKVISGLVNDKLQIRSCFSPCGNLVLSGSENATIGIWDADTSNIMEFISPKNHPNCFVTSVDYHPHDFYMAVGLASDISEPSPVLLYDYKAPHLAPVAIVQSTVAKFKSNLRKSQSHSGDGENEISRKNVTFAAQRGDSSEKFLNIINKLDKALKEAQDPKRIRPRDASLPRSFSLDLETEPKKTIRPNSASLVERPTEERPERNNNSTDRFHKMEPDRERSRSKSRGKSKSPRTYIENRLEELIIPQTKDEASSVERLSKETYKSEDVQLSNSSKIKSALSEKSIEQMSPKNLPKPARRQRPLSSKIPVRCAPESPQKGVGHGSSSPSPSNSPKTSWNRRRFNENGHHEVQVQVHSNNENASENNPTIQIVNHQTNVDQTIFKS